jgi:glycosyltransferase involved in cell wall biosynthesis
MTIPTVHLVDPSLFSAPYDVALASALRDLGLDVRLHGRPARPGEDWREEVEPRFYRISEGPVGRRLPDRLRLAVKGAEHLVDRHRALRAIHAAPGIVHLQWLPVPVLDGALVERLAGRMPVVLTVHDTASILGAATSRDRRGWRRAWEAARAVIVHTDEAADRLAGTGLPADHISVVPHPPLALPRGLTPTAFRPPVRRVVLFGEIKPYKGVDVALEALARTTSEDGQRLRLVVAGRPRMPTAPLLRQSTVLGLEDRVEWHLHRLDDRQLARVLSRADAFLLPYRRIDASGVLSMILALGRPVVGSRVGMLADLLGRRESGLLVPPDNPTALATALDQLASDQALATDLARRARATAADLGTWSDAALRHQAVYRRITGNGN